MMVSERRDAYLQTIAQLARERAAAKPVINSILTSGRDLWDVDIPAEWRTAGFVQELTAAAASILENDPKKSLSFAQLALAIATSIPSDAYPSPIQAQIEGSAWKEIGTAHRYMNEYKAALRAYDSARRAFGVANALAIDCAIADFARAIVLVELRRCDEALDLLKKTEQVFESFADKKHIVQAKVLRGNICTMQQRWKEARAIYEAALSEVPPDDAHTRSTVHENLGVARTELGDFDEALVNIHTARQLFVGLEMPIEVNRCDWNVARLLMQKGDFRSALTMLSGARDCFRRNSMPEEAGLAGLDLADGLIATDAMEQAHALVVQVLAEFTAADLNIHAQTALAYLGDVLRETPKPAEAVRHVRDYIERLREDPELLFLPLPD